MIQPGDRIPEVVVQHITPKGIEKTDTLALFGTGRTVLFAVPGAFTPTCSERHLPGYVSNFDAFRERGVDVACMAVNDPFVMQAWMQSAGVPEGLRMVADGNAELTRALGLELDASSYGMGIRSKRFAMLIEDGVARQVFVEAPGEFRVSTAENMLEAVGG
ncbi:peroxiredoxin [Lysobacter xinjiangensis]|uniref:Glutathione-dependent peroxiredoxin n=1 Tax=Cognatilysobacter xinjiangensis TaxID=546892 RepID=A0ABQ3BXC5_9GAMM|nr:peroxiredoxin [Lysobacter xinjiangensis]GGZ58358.1 peroxiredoxin [Lysobacter xinjiangensis]